MGVGRSPSGRRALPLDDVEEAWWHSRLPGDHCEVYYEGEKHPHERVMLWPTGPNTWIVGSPDGDEWEEDLSGTDPSSGPLKSAPLTRMGGHRNKDGHRMYRFRAPLSNKTLTDSIGLARDEAVAHESLDIGRPLPLEYVQ